MRYSIGIAGLLSGFLLRGSDRPAMLRLVAEIGDGRGDLALLLGIQRE